MSGQISIAKTVLSKLEFGEPRSSGALTLVPVTVKAPVRDYLLASEAFSSGVLQIKELGDGSVPNIVAINHSQLPVLFVDGEHLEGAKQSRVMNHSALIAANRETVLPVSCVEQGRWGYRSSKDFSVSPDMSYARLRALKQQEAATSARLSGRRAVNQGAVWAEVDRKHAEMGTVAPTGAMRDSYERARGELQAMRAAFAWPASDQTGVVACVSGVPVVMDLFDSPQTLASLWPRLLGGYAMDALGREEKPVSVDAVRGFVRAAIDGQATSHEGIGLGMDVILTGPGVVGNALTWSTGVVHAALFAAEQHEEHGGPRGARISSPTSRRRMRSYFHGA